MSELFDKAIVLDLFRQIVEHLEMTQKSFEAIPPPVSSRAERFAGALKLSEQQYGEFSDSVTHSRNEWDRDIF